MRLFDQLELVGRRLRLSAATVLAYRSWVEQYLRFCSRGRGAWTHPVDLGTEDCEAFLNDLVIRRRLSASSQNQALNALVFLYKHVLENALPQDHLGKFAILRSRRVKRVPTVLSTAEVRRVIEAVPAGRMSRLMIELLYGTGMRVGEVCTLRVRDIDMGRAQIIIRAAKGGPNRDAAGTFAGALGGAGGARRAVVAR